MPGRNLRHQYRAVNDGDPILTGTNSPVIEADEADGMLVYVDSDGALTLTIEGTNDDGTTWFDFTAPAMAPAGVETNVYPIVAPIPKKFRLANAGAGDATCSIELWRST